MYIVPFVINNQTESFSFLAHPEEFPSCKIRLVGESTSPFVKMEVLAGKIILLAISK